MAEMTLDEAGLRLVCSLRCCAVCAVCAVCVIHNNVWLLGYLRVSAVRLFMYYYLCVLGKYLIVERAQKNLTSPICRIDHYKNKA